MQRRPAARRAALRVCTWIRALRKRVQASRNTVCAGRQTNLGRQHKRDAPKVGEHAVKVGGRLLAHVRLHPHVRAHRPPVSSRARTLDTQGHDMTSYRGVKHVHWVHAGSDRHGGRRRCRGSSSSSRRAACRAQGQQVEVVAEQRRRGLLGHSRRLDRRRRRGPRRGGVVEIQQVAEGRRRRRRCGCRTQLSSPQCTAKAKRNPSVDGIHCDTHKSPPSRALSLSLISLVLSFVALSLS